jgi:hypothetical protein
MNKSQVALLVAGAVAGAGSTSFLTSVTREGTKYDVQVVRAVSAYLPDGGTQILSETCGLVNKHDGNTPQRWCDRRADLRMTALVGVAVDRLAEAAKAGEKKQVETTAKLEVIRQRQGVEAEKRKQERLAARDAGVPVPGQTP